MRLTVRNLDRNIIEYMSPCCSYHVYVQCRSSSIQGWEVRLYVGSWASGNFNSSRISGNFCNIAATAAKGRRGLPKHQESGTRSSSTKSTLSRLQKPATSCNRTITRQDWTGCFESESTVHTMHLNRDSNCP